MKKKIISAVSMLAVVFSMLFGQALPSAAAANEPVKVGESYLTMEDASEGSTSSDLDRGVHLMDGNSGISKAGRGRIYAYGSTTADHDVDFVSVVVFVDQYNEETGNWEQIATWTAEDTNTYYVSVGKVVLVERGYYYRVHCEHYAGNKADQKYDHDFSFTNGILVP